MTSRPALALLCLLLLPACSQVDDVKGAATTTKDCVALARDVAAAGLSRTPSREEAEAAVRRLDDRVGQLDDPDVRTAASTLRDRLRELQDAAAKADPAAVSAAADRARQAARDTAASCGLPVEQFLGS